MRNPRPSELPKNWKPGDSGILLDDSTVIPPTPDQLAQFEESDKRKSIKRDSTDQRDD